jgi:hypothetical protein
MISGSASSGRGGGLVAIAPAGSSSLSGADGTSGAGNRVARRVGLESSESSAVLRVLRIAWFSLKKI